ncbi:uncharacterized protein LOC114531566 [Dendronephthya gigantea]|uniref:uncharacterized protein LOC114531566 n=1 Tax=Dendronephthya gigantea TaxID=151771 RepID=UPI001069450E|nr:uncharacterized protein LOC114531566 [Dendronephthya gigantea]
MGKDSNSSSRVLDGIPEPLPDWNEDPEVWKWALPVHSYVFGITFFFIAVYGVYNLVKLCKSKMKNSRNYFVAITGLVCFLGFTRAVVLLGDPYSTRRPFALTPGYGLLLFSLGYPCLTSGFFLINWSLVEVTKLQLLPSRIHKRKVLALVLVIHFVVVITFDMIFVYFSQTIFLFICRSFFVVWGILLFGGFIVASIRLQNQVRQTLRNLTVTGNETPVARGQSNNEKNARPARFQEARTRKVMKIARRAAATGLLICCTQIYALWEFYVFYNNDVVPKAWPWWGYQTSFRCVELFMVSQMFLIIRPKK